MLSIVVMNCAILNLFELYNLDIWFLIQIAKFAQKKYAFFFFFFLSVNLLSENEQGEKYTKPTCGFSLKHRAPGLTFGIVLCVNCYTSVKINTELSCDDRCNI